NSARSSHLAGLTIHRELRLRDPSHPESRKPGRRFPSPPDRQMHPCFRGAVRSPVASRPAPRPFRQETPAFLPTEGAPPLRQGFVSLVPPQLLSPLKKQLAHRRHHAAPFVQIRCKSICSTNVVEKLRGRRPARFPPFAMLLDTSVAKGTRRFVSQRSQVSPLCSWAPISQRQMLSPPR